MPGFTPTNGSRIFIGPSIDIDTVDSLAEFQTITDWKEIKGFKDLGAFGDESAAITSNQLNVNRTMKRAGTKDAGSPAFGFDVKDGDEGQEAIWAANGDGFDYAFYIEFPNKKNASGQNGKRFFAGQVMSAREAGGAANNPITMTVAVGITTPIYRLAATAGA